MCRSMLSVNFRNGGTVNSIGKKMQPFKKTFTHVLVLFFLVGPQRSSSNAELVHVVL